MNKLWTHTHSLSLSGLKSFILLFLVCGFLSCENQKDQLTKENQSKAKQKLRSVSIPDDTDSVGFYHYKGMTHYFRQYNDAQDYDTVGKRIMNSLSDNYPNRFKYDSMISEFNKLYDTAVSRNFSIVTKGKFTYRNGTKIVKILRNKNIISSQLHDSLKLVFYEAIKNEDSARAAQIKTNIAEASWSKFQDDKVSDYFVATFNSSAKWINKNVQNGTIITGPSSPTVNAPSEAGDAITVIIADAAGSLYGNLCGPAAFIWSPIEAALFSSIAAANVYDTGWK